MSRQTRRGAENVRQDLATKELRRIALLCPNGMARKILSQVKAEHRARIEDDRRLVKDVRGRGGVCFPGGMTREEWGDRLPRSLHGRKRHCAPSDELAQELYDRGQLPDPSTDAVLDKLSGAYTRSRSAVPAPDEKELLKEAKRLIGDEVRLAVRELVKSAESHCEAACPQPLEVSLSGLTRGYSLGAAHDRSATIDERRKGLLRLARRKGCAPVLQSLKIARIKVRGRARASVSADIAWLRVRGPCSAR